MSENLTVVMTRETKILKEEAIVKLKELQTSGDVEMAHGEADNILCELLQNLGFEDVVKEYNEIDKWYA